MAKLDSKRIARAGIISALYVVLSVVVLPLSSGAIQIRFGEAMTILPLFFPESCVALFIGCAIVNLISGCALIEIVLGSFITLVSAILTCFIGRMLKKGWLKILVGGSFPILLNALLLPLIWIWCYGVLEYVYILQALLIFFGQAVAIYGLGTLTYFALEKILRKEEKKSE